MVGLKNGHIRKNLTQNGEPQRYSWGTQKERKNKHTDSGAINISSSENDNHMVVDVLAKQVCQSTVGHVLLLKQQYNRIIERGLWKVHTVLYKS